MLHSLANGICHCIVDWHQPMAWACQTRAKPWRSLFRYFGRRLMSEVSPAGEPVAVIKIGGSILTNARAYRRAALFVRNRHRISPGERLVVVVSAQKDSTDALELAAKKITESPHPAALDILWSTGELRSVALLPLHF